MRNFGLTPRLLNDISNDHDVYGYYDNLPFILKALDKYGIYERNRVIALFATVLTEVRGLRPVKEFGGDRYFDQVYDRDPGLWDWVTQSYRWIGRGYAQITWKENYAYYGKLLNLDLVNNPDLALDPEVAAEILVLFFLNNSLFTLADAGKWYDLRVRYNGGTNGMDEYLSYVEALRQAIPKTK